MGTSLDAYSVECRLKELKMTPWCHGNHLLDQYTIHIVGANVITGHAL